jgi:hypothetical protein
MPKKKTPADDQATNNIPPAAATRQAPPAETETPKRTFNRQEKEWMKIECGNCRAPAGEPCKWEDGAFCVIRTKVSERKKAGFNA